MGFWKKIYNDFLPSPQEALDVVWKEWKKLKEQEKREKRQEFQEQKKEEHLKKFGYWIPIPKKELRKREYLITHFEGILLKAAPEYFQDIPEEEGLVVVRYLKGEESARFAHTEEAFYTLTAQEPQAKKDFILIKFSFLCGLTGCEEEEYERRVAKNHQENMVAQKGLNGREEITADCRINDSDMWKDIDPDVYGYPLLNKNKRAKTFNADYLVEKHSGLLLKEPPSSFSKILKGQALIVILEKNHTDNARFAHTSRAFINLVKSPRDPWCGQSTHKKYVYLDYPVACKMTKFSPASTPKSIKPKTKKKTKSKGR